MIMYRTLKTKYGVLIFFLSLAAVAVIGYTAQSAWGIYGLAVTEVIILLFAVIPVIFFKADPGKIFPVKIPAIRQLNGSLILWFGTYLIVLLITQITMYLFPEGLLDIADGMSDFISGNPMAVSVLVIAIMPAICEEMLYRGFIQHSFQAIGKWPRILLVGFMFGLFHLDPYRFLPTALLGMAITYAMIQTGNLIVPVFMHFINNMPAVYFAYIGGESTLITQNQMLITIGAFSFLAAFSPFLILLGAKLLSIRGSKVFTKLRTGIAVLLFISLFSLGIYALSGFKTTGEPIFRTNMSISVNHETPPNILPIKVEQKGNYQLDLSIVIEEGAASVFIIDPDGAEIFSVLSQETEITQLLEMVPGEYTFMVNYVFNEAIEGYASCNINILIK